MSHGFDSHSDLVFYQTFCGEGASSWYRLGAGSEEREHVSPCEDNWRPPCGYDSQVSRRGGDR